MLKSCESCSASIKHIDTTSIKSNKAVIKDYQPKKKTVMFSVGPLNLSLGLVDSLGCIPFPPCQLIWLMIHDLVGPRKAGLTSDSQEPWLFEGYLYSTSNQINWINSRYMTRVCIDTDGLQILSKFRSHKVSHHVTLKRNNLNSRSQSDSKVVEANCNIGFHPWWPGNVKGFALEEAAWLWGFLRFSSCRKPPQRMHFRELT